MNFLVLPLLKAQTHVMLSHHRGAVSPAVFTRRCSFCFIRAAQGWDVKGIEGLRLGFSAGCFPSKLDMSLCCNTKNIHVHTTCSLALFLKCWHSRACPASLMRSPVKSLILPSIPCFNCKQACSYYSPDTLNASSNIKVFSGDLPQL